MTLKVLGVLRILGTGCSTDAVLELSGISESHMSKFFHQFCAWGHEKAFPVWVTWPKTTAGTYGACNDKTLIRFDDFIRELRENPLYTTNIEYKLKVAFH